MKKTISRCLARVVPTILCLGVLTPGWCPAQSGGVMREVYEGIGGSSVSDLVNSSNYPDSPTFIEFIEDFEAPTDVADDYGQRLRAYLVPPETGSYRFWIASDDASVLFVSTDDTSANKQQIAEVPGWTNSREWNRYPEQESSLIYLTAGQRYYIEALMKEGWGGDNLAVRWQLPSGGMETPISGNRLEAFGLGPPLITQHPQSTSADEGGEAIFSVRLEHGFGAGYQWQRNGVDIPGATAPDYVLSPVRLIDNNAGFRCTITNGLGSATSSTAYLSVIADTVPPTLVSASTLDSPNRITLVFSEPVDPSTALQVGNYGLSAGASVQAVRFAGDASSVVLETSALAPGVSYLLSVSNVRDQATVPNTIPPGSTAWVSFTFVPLGIDLVRPIREPLGPSRRRSGLIISEIMYNPAPRPDALNTEFVEIYNSEEISVDLGGYRISGDIAFTIPVGTMLPSHEFLVLAPEPADVESGYGISGVLGGFSQRLGNGGGVLRLRNRLDAVLCEVEFDDDSPWPAAADNGGHSLVLARPSYGEDDVRAWSASSLAGGSPGTAEPVASTAYATIMINEILSHTDEPLVDYVELYNYSTGSVDLGGCILTDDPASNRYKFAAGTQIPGLGYRVVDQAALGFALSAAGETLYLKVPDGSRVIDAIRFGPQAPGTGWGRYPDGGTTFEELSALTPGEANASPLTPGVVINELMYHPPSGEREDEFIELHDLSGVPTELGGWRLSGGIEYSFPAGTLLPADGYLVVARDPLRLLTSNPGLNSAAVVGGYSGSLADGGEAVRLEFPEDLVTIHGSTPVTNTVYITADEVAYRDGGRWGTWADGGGSSLELIDPRADNTRASNWADSDETAKSAWVTIEHTGALDLGNGSYGIDELQMMLLGAGECLIDDVEVTSDGGANRVPDGTFESGVEAWLRQGNHVDSGWSEAGEGDAGTRGLRLVASSGGDNGANRVQSGLTSSLSEGATATLRARARWLRGHPDLLLRLQGNHLEALGTLPIPANLGTPGLPNSRARANTGPAIDDLSHFPVLPGHMQPVTVVARVHDPDGLARLHVRYRLDPDDEVHTASMINRGGGWFAASLPGQAAGTLLAFRVEAADASPDLATTTYPADPDGRECLIRFGDPTPTGSFGVYRMWMTQANIATWTAREKLSNEPVDGTFVLGDYRAVYNAGARYRGSPFVRPSFNSPIGNSCAYVWTLPKDEPVLGTDELNLDSLEPGRDDTYQRERTSFWIADQLGVPFSHQRYVRILFNGNQRGDVYSDSQQPNGDYVQSWFANDDRGEIFKIDDWFEFSDSFGFNYVTARLEDYTTTGGVKKQARYRWNWEKKSNRGLDDDYSRLFALVDALNQPDPDDYLAAVEEQIDFEQWMRVFAARRIVADWDGYSYERGKNQFAYKPEDDGWKMLLWDLDFSLGGGGGRDPTEGLFNGIEDPTIVRMYSTPTLVRAYLRALHDAAYGPLESARVGPVLSAHHAALVSNGLSYTETHPAGVADWISQRRTFILGELGDFAAPFAITSNGGANFSSPVNLVTLAGTAPVQVRTVTLNGVVYPVDWTSILEWETRVALGPGANLLQLGAVDSSGNLIPGLTDSITVTYTGPGEDPGDVLVINEIMYNSAIPDAAFVEIHNRSAISAFDLTGHRLGGADFAFLPGTIVEPGAFVVIANDFAAYRSAYGSVDPVIGVMDGRLDNGGETLRLIRLGTTPDLDQVLDEVTYEDDPPWPGLADGFGPSLQLIDPALDNNRVGNWVAASSQSGGDLVDYPDVWTYHDEGVDLGSGWKETVFDDSAWPEGSSLLARETASLPEPIRTVLKHGARTYYFRHHFAFSGDPGSFELSLETIIDDGAVFYLNGVEVWRLGMEEGTTVTYQSLANRTVSNATREGPFPIPSSALQVGDNVLAVEVHNAGANSTDEVMGLRLTADSGVPSPVPYTPGAANQTGVGAPAIPALWLNEVQPGNLGGPQDNAGEHDPWIELHNSGNVSIDLNGFLLSPDYGATLWSFPPGASIGAGEFQVVWVDGETNQTVGSEYHTSFRLTRYDGSISLLRGSGGGLVVDYLDYGILLDDRSYGAWPDGSPTRRRAFYFATPADTNNPAYPDAPVAINEWVSDNQSTAFDPADGRSDDWFELVNLGPAPVDLSGFFLTDDLANPNQWVIPAGTILDPGGFLLVWADDETNQNQVGQTDLHAGFKLSRDGEELGLFAPNQAPVDTLSFSAQLEDQSHGRWPDGSASIIALDPITPGASNLVDTNANEAPVIGPVENRNADEQTELRIVISATDVNLGQELTFSLGPGAPTGATLNPQSGVFLWTPAEQQGPGSYPVSVTVTDDGVPPMNDAATFTVSVGEVNSSPGVDPIPQQKAWVDTPFSVQAMARDADLPANGLTLELEPSSPAGVSLDPDTGWIRWVPSVTQTDGVHPVTLRVTDNGNPPLSASYTFFIEVGTLNVLQLTGMDYLDPDTLRLDWVPDLSGPNAIQVSDELAEGVWTPIGGIASPPLSLSIGNEPYRAYRVVAPPQ